MPGRADPATRVILDRLYRRFHRFEYVAMDPLAVVYDYTDWADRELAGLIAAGLAFGDATQIQRAAREVLGRIGPRPAEVLRALSPRDIRQRAAGFRYRWVSDEALAAFLLGLGRCLRAHGSVEAWMAAGGGQPAHPADAPETLRAVLMNWTRDFLRAMGIAKHPMWPDPERGGACKRTLLYLRWMVRRDQVDPGCWTLLTPAMLVCPVDRHVHRFALRVGITRRATADWRTAVEITRFFRALCPRDPCRWDFALTRAAMLDALPEAWRGGSGGVAHPGR
ncbi:MAG: TIGR02757 family protein [Candidatus Hydrogenedentes bacterium]|nr:TIGR02757 family protein [Candidatus Hydrogenedentota bacterium]